jgi:hypothetical protein
MTKQTKTPRHVDGIVNILRRISLGRGILYLAYLDPEIFEIRDGRIGNGLEDDSVFLQKISGPAARGGLITVQTPHQKMAFRW